jgi:hypothetical protein
MSTTYEKFSRVVNTSLSDSEMLASVHPAEIQALEFQHPAIVPVTATGGSGYALTVKDLIYAGTNGLPVVTQSSASYLSLGADTAANAASLQQVIGVTATGAAKILRFVPTAAYTGAVLNNSSATATYVKLQLNGGSATGAANLFGLTLGKTADVVVSATTLTLGSEVINFNVIQAL